MTSLTHNTLHIYNTLTRTLEEFTPRKPGRVGLYVCGPTVYDRAHIGNARPVVVFDTLYRILSLENKVTYVKNITDIDDKIIKAAQEQKVQISEITEKFTKLYQKDMAALNALPPSKEPRATDNVPEMISMIKSLIEKKHAYVADGHVLFDTTSDENYGCLSHQPLDDMIAGARVEVAPYKKNPQDFVLWKPSNDGDPGWESPWNLNGKLGRPGWHIECSAMGLAHLGATFDIHGGGLDLSFPHHENEIAQSTCALGRGTFARYWMHNGMLMVNGAKMSKSLGNFYTVADLFEQANGETIRFAILSCQYRQPLDWQKTTLPQAKAALDGLYTALEGFGLDEDSPLAIDDIVLTALYDDLNTPKAIARLHELAKEANKAKTETEKRDLQKVLRDSGSLLGILQQEAINWFQGPLTTTSNGLSSDEIQDFINKRTQARLHKDFAESDRIRDYLLEHHISLEDSATGTLWKRR